MNTEKNKNLVIGIITVVLVMIMIINRLNEVKSENTPEAIKSERM
jgi:hypothetical protein